MSQKLYAPKLICLFTRNVDEIDTSLSFFSRLGSKRFIVTYTLAYHATKSNQSRKKFYKIGLFMSSAVEKDQFIRPVKMV
jgi:hypothetical protein